MKYDIIMYDLDGTLFNYEIAEENALEKTLNYFYPNCNIEAAKKYYREINAEIWKLFELKNITAEKLRVERFRRLIQNRLFANFGKLDPHELSEMYLNNLASSAILLDGALEVVSFFHKKVRQLIISNGLSDVQYSRINRSPLVDFFTDIFISEEIGSPKPDAGIFDHIQNKIGFNDKTRVIIVGDNLYSDIKGGNDFGVDTCWFNYNNLHNETGIRPKYEIKNLKELIRIIK